MRVVGKGFLPIIDKDASKSDLLFQFLGHVELAIKRAPIRLPMLQSVSL